jgi:hypothetical protein
MSNFFQSEMVRGDLQEMAQLQEFCMRSMMTFPVLSTQKQLDYFNVLGDLIEKQKIFYTRLILSDDEEARDMVESMKDSVVLLGGDPSDDIMEMFDGLILKVDKLKEEAEKRLAQGG